MCWGCVKVCVEGVFGVFGVLRCVEGVLRCVEGVLRCVGGVLRVCLVC